MARPLWNGSVSFGLVNVPIKLFKAQSPKDVRFHQLHQKDGMRIQQKRVCPADGEEVPYDEVVKGFEVAPDRYVVVDPEELTALDPKASHTIEISDFVDLHEIDPLLYERGYYMVPDERAAKSYALLVAAMTETNKVAIARFVMRTKEYLCAIRPKDNMLVLETMLFPDEVVGIDEIPLPELEVEPTDKELTMAKQLVESLASSFEPEKYEDEYRNKVMALIEAKAEGNEFVTQPETEQAAPIVDLMAALEASLEAAKNKQQRGQDQDEVRDKEKRRRGA